MNNLRIAGLLSLTVFAVADSYAGTWFWKADAKTSVSQDDNVRLTSVEESEIDASSLGVSGSVTVSQETEDVQAAIKPWFNYRNYSSNEDLDYTTYGLNGDLNKRFERSIVGLLVKADRDTTLTSEYEESGNLLVKLDRSNLVFQPNAKYLLTPLSKLTVDGAFRTVDYEEHDDYFDYDTSRVDFGYELDLTPQDQTYIKIYTSNFESVDRGSESDTVGALLGWQHLFSQRTSVTVQMGRYEIDSELTLPNGDIVEESSGTSYQIGLKHRTETTSYALTVSSQLTPSSIGVVRKTDRFDASLNHSFTSRLSAGLSSTFFTTESTNRQYTSDDREYQTADVSLSWRLDPLWALRGGYRYRYQKYDDRTDSATSNQFSISVGYNSYKSNI